MIDAAADGVITFESNGTVILVRGPGLPRGDQEPMTLIARIARAIGMAIAGVVVAGIVLVLADANEENGLVDGIGWDVDRNLFLGDERAFREDFCGLPPLGAAWDDPNEQPITS